MSGTTGPVAGTTGATYAGAGVDIAAGDEAVARIADVVASTARPEVLGGIGDFAGRFLLDTGRFRRPVLVSSTDGVGTKMLVAKATGRYDTVGIDLVAMCVDDIVCAGAEPLFLLDYVAVGRLVPERLEAIVGGIAAGCRAAGCALVGGETAEHPDAMAPDDVDLAGFALGVAEQGEELGRDRVEVGDVLVGLPSPGLRSNGYSLARRVLLEGARLPLDGPAWDGAAHTLADELLAPSVVYAPAVMAARAAGARGVHACAHITGGGIAGNLSRVLPEHLDARLERGAWEEPRIFREIARLGAVADEEMARVFNLGLGMILVVSPGALGAVVRAIDAVLGGTGGPGGRGATVVGEIVSGSGEVLL
jgi:phosphoribosylformylglycinamidine cyclo-ligase